MKTLLFLTACLFFPVVAAVNGTAKESPCTPEKWKKAIFQFELDDAKKPPPQQSYLFVGSSSIRMWDLPKYFPHEKPINRGYGGSELCDTTHYVKQLILKHKPRVVVLYAGDNDIARGKSAEQVHQAYNKP